MLFLCAEGRGRTPARSIDAAIVREAVYGRDCRLANGIYRHNIIFPGDVSRHFAGVPALIPLPRPDAPTGRNTTSDFDLSIDHPLFGAVCTAALRVIRDFIAKEKFSKR